MNETNCSRCNKLLQLQKDRISILRILNEDASREPCFCGPNTKKIIIESSLQEMEMLFEESKKLLAAGEAAKARE